MNKNNLLKLTGMIFVFAILPVVLALTGVTQIDTFYDSANKPVTNVQSVLYNCAGVYTNTDGELRCTNVGSLLYNLNSGSTNKITFIYPYNPLSTQANPTYYSHYLYKECYLPKDYIEYVWGYSSTLNYDYNFNKAKDCKSPLTGLSVTNQNYVAEPISINVNVELASSVQSPFVDYNDGEVWYPNTYNDYYSADTRVIVEIIDASGIVVYTDSKVVSLYMGASQKVKFDWTPTTEGVYSARIKTRVIDCQCENTIVQTSPVKQFTVLPERAHDIYYSLIQDLIVTPTEGELGTTFHFSFDKISNYIDDDYILTPMATNVEYQIINNGIVIYSNSFVAPANSGTTTYQNVNFDWVSTQTGSLYANVILTARTNDNTRENLPESMRINFVVNPNTPSVIDNDGDGYNSDVDCNDNNPNIWGLILGYVDGDNDDYGIGFGINICSGANLPSGYAYVNGDCNDANINMNPGAIEVCDGVDNDCDGVIDEGGVCGGNNAPTLNIPDQIVNEGSTISFNIDDYADDIDGNVLSYNFISGVGGLVGIGGNFYSYTASQDVNTINEVYTVVIEVDDGNGGVTQDSFTITVNDDDTTGNTSPVISEFIVTPNSGTIPLIVSFIGSVIDADGDNLICTINYGDGTSNYIDNNCNTIDIVHTYINAGTYIVTLNVADGTTTITQTITITANNIAPGIIIVDLVSPLDNADLDDSNVRFRYNINSGNALDRCELYIDNNLARTDSSPINNAMNEFIVDMSDGDYDWRVECYDVAGISDVSETRSFSVEEDGNDDDSGEPVVLDSRISKDGSGSLLEYIDTISLNGTKSNKFEIKIWLPLLLLLAILLLLILIYLLNRKEN